jgi:hypothetical protein
VGGNARAGIAAAGRDDLNPPLLTTVLLAVPPDSTVSVSPEWRTMPLLVWPKLTV